MAKEEMIEMEGVVNEALLRLQEPANLFAVHQK